MARGVATSHQNHRKTSSDARALLRLNRSTPPRGEPLWIVYDERAYSSKSLAGLRISESKHMGVFKVSNITLGFLTDDDA